MWEKSIASSACRRPGDQEAFALAWMKTAPNRVMHDTAGCNESLIGELAALRVYVCRSDVPMETPTRLSKELLRALRMVIPLHHV